MLKIKLDNENCMPFVGSEGAAGIDLRAGVKTAAGFTLIPVGGEWKVSTGVSMEIPKGWVGLVMPRSGLGCKFKLRLDNTIGVIDEDYRGVIQVFMTNCGTKDAIIEDFERICQIVIVPRLSTEFILVDALSDTVRGTKGFGHSGKQ